MQKEDLIRITIHSREARPPPALDGGQGGVTGEVVLFIEGSKKGHYKALRFQD